MSDEIVIRLVEERDLPAILAIYNHEVLHTTTTLDTVPHSLDDRRRWLAAHPPDRYPAFVADRGGEALGWAALTAWSPRLGYARTAEVSVYVDREARRLGIGRRLLVALEEAGRRIGLGVLLARIGGDSAASQALHLAAGYRHLCKMARVGEKHGRLLDIELFELRLDE